MKIGSLLFLIVLLVTAVLLGVALAAILNPRISNKAGPYWIWSLRRYDPVRNVLFRADGSFRRYSRFFLSSFLALTLIGVLYILIASGWVIFSSGS